MLGHTPRQASPAGWSPHHASFTGCWGFPPSLEPTPSSRNCESCRGTTMPSSTGSFGIYAKIKAIQRRLAWPQRKQNRELPKYCGCRLPKDPCPPPQEKAQNMTTLPPGMCASGPLTCHAQCAPASLRLPLSLSLPCGVVNLSNVCSGNACGGGGWAGVPAHKQGAGASFGTGLALWSLHSCTTLSPQGCSTCFVWRSPHTVEALTAAPPSAHRGASHARPPDTSSLMGDAPHHLCTAAPQSHQEPPPAMEPSVQCFLPHPTPESDFHSEPS